MRFNKYFYTAAAILIFSSAAQFGQTTLEQFLEVVQNDGVIGGQFHVAIKVKGTNLTAANTLGSCTIDVTYNSSQITFLDAGAGVIATEDGYAVSFNNNNSEIRFGVLGNNVGPGLFEGPGHDLSVSYETFITLQFTILDDQAFTTLSIIETTNQIGLFDNHSNIIGSGIIDNQTLSPPININNEPIPVELLSFSAHYFENKVMLEWVTATEINNFGFQIERKAMSEENAQWRNIGFVTGAGNSSESINYQYSDENLNSDHYFYRLKQIDYDGTFAYSNKVEVKFDLIVEDFILAQNYPNPFNPSTQIIFGFKENTQASLKVYNTIGELVSELFNAKTKAGNLYSVTFNADKLPSGMYLYELRGNNFVEVQKMLLLK